MALYALFKSDIDMYNLGCVKSVFVNDSGI